MTDANIEAMKMLSPRRNTTNATSVTELAQEQLAHFSIDPESDYGKTLLRAVERMYESQSDVCLLYTSPSPRDRQKSRMPSSA